MTSLRRSRGEDGAILLVTALLLVSLLTIVAFAIDLGQGRFARRSNQSTVDLAAAAAGYYLAGNGNGDTVNLDARHACEAAVNSAATNIDAIFIAVPGFSCGTFPTGTGASRCQDDDDFKAVYEAGAGKWRLTIDYPVPNVEISEPRFSDGTGVVDGDDPCKRLGVSIERVDETTFARVIGVDRIQSAANAVVRGGPALNANGVAALLVLEREGCQALQTSGQGAVIVQTVVNALGDEQPGVIGSDSAGSTLNYGSGLECKTVTNATGYPIYGTARPASVGGGPSIIAESTTDSEGNSNHDGIIGSYALKVAGRSACCPDGLSEVPVPTPVTSRTPADTRYNSDENPAIRTLHSVGYTASVTNGVVTGGSTDCEPADGTVFDGGGAPIELNCPSGFRVRGGRTVRFENAPSVKFSGGVEVRSTTGPGTLQISGIPRVEITRSDPSANARLVVSGTASFDDVSHVYVGGTPNACTTTNNCSAVNVTSGGALRINTGDVATATCPSTPGSATPVGSPDNWVQMATFGGEVSIESGASVSWCQTSLYVGRDTPTYERLDYMRIGGGINCTNLEPCPLVSTAPSRNRFLLSGGNAFIRWTAPDQTANPPSASSPFESLALWSEGTGLQTIKGTGDMRTTGVFILPNAMFEFDGQAVAENPFDAQFFTRGLNFSGQGIMYLKPDPRNAIPTTIPGEFSLIR